MLFFEISTLFVMILSFGMEVSSVCRQARLLESNEVGLDLGKSQYNVTAGNSVQICLVKEIGSVLARLDSPRTLVKLNVSSGLKFVAGSEAVMYSYNGNIWYNSNAVLVDSATLSLSSYALFFRFNLTKRDFGSSNCAFLSFYACIVDLLPEVSLNPVFAELQSERIFTCSLFGQPGILLEWSLLPGYQPNLVSRTQSLYSGTENRTEVVSVALAALIPFACIACLNRTCHLTLTCSGKYENSSAAAQANSTLELAIPIEPAVNLVIESNPVALYLSWQMSYSGPICAAVTTVIMRNGTLVATVARNVTSFSIGNLTPCMSYEIMLYTLNGNGLKSISALASAATSIFYTPAISNLSLLTGFVEVLWNFTQVKCKPQEEAFMLTLECIPLPAMDLYCPLPLNIPVNISDSRKLVPTSKIAGFTWTLFLSSNRSVFQVPDFRSNVLRLLVPDSLPAVGPSNLRYFVLNSSHINVSWDSVPISSRNGIITHYEVSSRSSSTTVILVTMDMYIILLWETFCSYEVVVVGCTTAGCATSTSSVYVSPLVLPANVNILQVGEESFSLGYFNVTRLSSCASAVSTQHRKALSADPWIVRNHSVDQFGVFNVAGLLPGLPYEVQVRIVSLFGLSNWSFPISVATLHGMPGQVRNMTVIPGLARLVVRWLVPEVPNGAVLYRVSIFGSRYYNSSFNDQQVQNTSLLTITFTASPATEYNVSVATYNSRYTNTQAVSRIVTVLPFLPNAPRDPPSMYYCLAGNFTVTAEISSVDDSNGPISYYEIFIAPPGPQPAPIRVVNYAEAVDLNLSYYVTLRLQRFAGIKVVILGDNSTANRAWNKPLNLSQEFATFYRAVINWTGTPYISRLSPSMSYQPNYEPIGIPASPVIDYATLSKQSVSIEITALSESMVSMYEVFVFLTDIVPSVVLSVNISEAGYLGLSYYVAKAIASFSGKSAVTLGEGLNEGRFLDKPLNLSAPQYFAYRAVKFMSSKASPCKLSLLVKLRSSFDIRSMPVASTSKTGIVFSFPAFDSSIDFVEIFAVRVGLSSQAFNTSRSTNLVVNFTTYAVAHASSTSLPYLAALLPSSALIGAALFSLGTGNTSVLGRSRRAATFFDNGPLDSGIYYSIFYRVHGTDGYVQSTSWHAAVRTEDQIAPGRSGISSSAKAAIIVCSILAVFILFGLVLLRWWCKARRQNADKSSSYEMKSQSENGKVNLAYESDSGKEKRRPYTLTYPIDLQHNPIPMAEFPERVAELKESDGFAGEFEQLETVVDFPCDVAKDPINSRKNRYEDVLPFDNSRVKLDLGKSSTSDYINASFVDGYDRTNAYIATQGPLPETLTDFWKMVWQENCYTIVMLCNMVESGIIKCSHYWPKAGKKEKYGKVSVKRADRFQYDSYTVTNLQVQMNSSPPREIRLYHFANWPDRIVPASTTQILACRRDVRRWEKKQPGPVVVHCSGGIGRTGAFIALDAILKNIPSSGTVDVFNYVNYLRQRRVNMVQTVSQYEFIHDAILETLTQTPSVAEITSSTIESIIAELSNLDEVTRYSGFQKLFRKLTKTGTFPSALETSAGRLPENAYKNRYANKIPLDRYRVTLPVKGSANGVEYANVHVQLTVSGSDTDFINATLLSEGLITTQCPLAFTVQDFWRMVYAYDVHTLVLLNEIGEEPSCVQFWPQSGGRSLNVDALQVRLDCESSAVNGMIEREFSVFNEGGGNEKRKIASYQLCAWPDHGVPSSPKPAVALIQSLLSHWRDHGCLLVVCSDGLGRSGCFAACLLAIKDLSRNGSVNVNDLLRDLRERHTGYIETESQFCFLFEVIRAYCATANMPSNY